MTDLQLVQLRRRYRREGGMPEALRDELFEAAQRVFKHGRPPASYAPQGVWNPEAEEDAYQGWLATRLGQEGALQALLDKARDAKAFRRLAEQNFRQYLNKARERSESQNLYKRLRTMLRDEPETFRCFRTANKPQHAWWGLAAWTAPAEYACSEEHLLAVAWGLGDFTVFRYGAAADHLGPVLKTPELQRFICGLLATLDASLSLDLMMTVLRSRFQLDHPAPEALAEELGVAHSEASHALLDKETAVAILLELSGPQVKVMLARDEEPPRSVAKIAAELECSTGTVSNEQDRIAIVFHRHVPNDDELPAMVKKVIDLVYEVGEDQ
jgi:hypothetical protein